MKLVNNNKRQENALVLAVGHINNTELSKSDKIRKLWELGLTINEIGAFVGVRYNFVYNVLSEDLRLAVIKAKKPEEVQVVEVAKEGVQAQKELPAEPQKVTITQETLSEIHKLFQSVASIQEKMEKVLSNLAGISTNTHQA